MDADAVSAELQGARVWDTPRPRAPWGEGVPVARVEAVQVGGVQYRVRLGTFVVEASPSEAVTWVSSETPEVTYRAAQGAVEMVRLAPQGPA